MIDDEKEQKVEDIFSYFQNSLKIVCVYETLNEFYAKQ